MRVSEGTTSLAASRSRRRRRPFAIRTSNIDTLQRLHDSGVRFALLRIVACRES